MAAAILFLAAAAIPAAAQETGQITGQVINAGTGEPLIGAQVVVQGTTIGSLTDNRGRFLLLNVPAGSRTVEVTAIGYADAERQVSVAAGETAAVEFALRQRAIEMEGVVVTGTAGAARRREVGTTVSQINVDQLQTTPIKHVGDVLQGRTAGVQIMDNSGQVGAGSSIRLRGNNSLAGNNPLIYVDGVRIASRSYGQDPEVNQAASPLHDINPNDIDRIEIVKGAAATTLYGTEAAGGVIQIFTKRGATGDPVWSFSLDQGINSMGHVGPREDPSGQNLNNCTLQEPADPTCPGSWLRNGRVQRYNLSVRGGREKITYFFSGKLADEEGVLPTQGSSDYGVRGNFSFFPIDPVQINFNSSYNQRNINWVPDGNNAEGFLINVMRGDKGYTPENRDALALEMGLNTLTQHFTTGVGVTWTPRTGMTHRLNGGLDYAAADYQEEKPFLFYFRPEGERENDQRLSRTMTLEYAGTWDVPVRSDIRSSFSWGGQVYEDFFSRLTGFGESFAGPGAKLVGSGALTTADEGRIRTVNGGFFLQEQIGWRDRLFVTLGGRWDGFSSFGEDFGLAFYPKLSAAYMLSDQAFWPQWWETMKVRAAVGESGQAPGTFDALRTWQSTSGDEGLPAVTPRSVGAPDLGPERTREWETGFETSLFGERVTGEFTYYNQYTYDALVDVQQLPSGGLGVFTQQENVGEIRNRGTEASLNFAALRGRSLSWDIGLRHTTNRSEVVTLTEGITGIYLGWRNEARPGFPLPSYFHSQVVNPNEVGVEPIIVSDTFIGPSYPTYTIGANTSVTLGRRLTIDALGEFQGGHYLSNGTGYQQMRRGVWVPCHGIQEQFANNPKDNQFAGLRAADVAKCIPKYSSYGVWTMPADFFKLRSVSVSYRIPSELFGDRFTSAVVSLQGRNLLTVTDYDGLDPETSEEGSTGTLFRQEYYNLPPFRSFVLNFRVTL